MKGFNGCLVIWLNCIFLPGFCLKGEHVLDTSYPIVIQDNSGGEIPSKSFFGYSVSLSESDQAIDFPKGWIFIGAPKGNTSTFRYDSVDFEPGVLWRCSLGRSLDDCYRMNIDPRPNSGGRPKPGNPANENHTSAFIGVTTQLSHDKLVTCGHNYKRGLNKYYNGICYWFPHDSSSATSYRTSSMANLFDPRAYEQRLIPFFTQNKDDERLFVFDNPSGVKEEGHEWQQGQAGLSAHLFQDEKNMTNLLVGAVGVREWSGAVVLYTNEVDPSLGNKCKYCARPNRKPNDPRFSKFHVLNRGNIPRKGNTLKEKLWLEYFGYSVSSGRYFAKNQTLFASGAPRGDSGRGAVEIFTRSEEATMTGNKSQIEPVIRLTPPGNAFGSYFGAALHSVDLDGDGLDELVVGAPMYSFEAGGQGNNSRELGDKGSVFLYSFQNFQENITVLGAFQVLDGSKARKGRFGSAISSMPFEHKDGTREIYLVIGAPFEEATRLSTGAIYLYSFDKVLRKLVMRKRITAGQIQSGLLGFGSSFSFGTDIDQNRTPDLAIGAFLSGHAVVLRSRPRIELNGELKFYAKNETSSNPVDKILRDSRNFFVTSCYTIKETFGLVVHQVGIWTRLKILDKNIKFNLKSVGNIQIKEMSDTSVLFYRTGIDAHDSTTCDTIEIVAASKHGIGTDDSDVIIENAFLFNFTQQVWYNDTLSTQINPFKIFTSGQPSGASFQDFKSNWPSPSSCSSTNSIRVVDCIRNCRPKLVMTFSFFNSGSNQAVQEFVLGSYKEVVMNLTIENQGEFAEKMEIEFAWSTVMITESIRGNRWLHSNCINRTTVEQRRFQKCLMPIYIRKGRKTTIQIFFNMEHIYATSPDHTHFNLAALVSFQDKHNPPVELTGSLLLKTPDTRVQVDGSTENEILRDSETQGATLMSSFRQRYSVTVYGSPVSSVEMEVRIPVAWSDYEGNMRQIFKVAHPRGSMGNLHCTSKYFDFHQINEAVTHSREAPRSQALTSHPVNESDHATDNSTEPQISQDILPRTELKKKPTQAPAESLLLECQDKKNCMEVTCVMSQAKANTRIHIHFDTFPIRKEIESLISVTGKSILFVRSESAVKVFSGEPKTEYRDMAYGGVVLTRPVPKWEWSNYIWPLVASILGAIFLLALIIYGLYKCGFFKRQKRIQLNQMKEEHRRKSMIAMRGSMMPPIDPGDESRLSLTLAEHQNEETLPPIESKRLSALNEVDEVTM